MAAQKCNLQCNDTRIPITGKLRELVSIYSSDDSEEEISRNESRFTKDYKGTNL